MKPGRYYVNGGPHSEPCKIVATYQQLGGVSRIIWDGSEIIVPTAHVEEGDSRAEQIAVARNEKNKAIALAHIAAHRDTTDRYQRGEKVGGAAAAIAKKCLRLKKEFGIE